jgi:hypothetical protein
MPDSDMHLPPRNNHSRRPEIAAIILPLCVATTDVFRQRVTLHRGTQSAPLPMECASTWLAARAPAESVAFSATLHRLGCTGGARRWANFVRRLLAALPHCHPLKTAFTG